ncbi:hypothetical protein WN55_04260 [Dufourea novaeangliae]|uniref:Uncharacterized protein n=1 Tax=Dufourea novaeangliae TaxID=178035 RepID=A0A154NZF0_DUFNO|nr:hypothetical protein WN55_04260 [Dufourea novaeangliae]
MPPQIGAVRQMSPQWERGLRLRALASTSVWSDQGFWESIGKPLRRKYIFDIWQPNVRGTQLWKGLHDYRRVVNPRLCDCNTVPGFNDSWERCEETGTSGNVLDVAELPSTFTPKGCCNSFHQEIMLRAQGTGCASQAKICWNGMCDELKNRDARRMDQRAGSKVERSDKQPDGILSSRRHESLVKRLKERPNEKSLCPKG